MNDETQHDRSHRTPLARGGHTLTPPQMRVLNDAEKLQDYSKLVKWVLWSIATYKHPDEGHEPTPEEEIAARHAQHLFGPDGSKWVAQCVAQFALNHSAHNSTEQSVDYLAFLGLTEAQRGEEKA